MSTDAAKSSGTENVSDEAGVRPGEMLAGKFRVERVVGRGGMGVVVEATNIQLDQRVALKLLATGKGDPEAVERFSREARAAARLKSEHVARVYDVGKDTLHGPFIVMEMLHGRTLGDVIKTGRTAVNRAVEYVIDACEGLSEAHARGIVHQDVKPPNLFLVTGADGKPSIKLLDFGIATIHTKEREAVTKSSHPSAGTPAYLAPEQVRASGPIDHRADIWALGCVLYELLAGERAFRATRFTELVTAILETPPHPFPADLELPPQLAAVVIQCLEKDPAKRFRSTGELAIRLLPFARRRAHSAVARAVAHAKSAGLDPDLEIPETMPPPPDSGDFPSSNALRAARVPSFSSLPSGPASSKSPAVISPPPTSRRRGEIALVVAVVLLIGVAVAVWARGSRATSTSTATTPTTTTTASLVPSAALEEAPASSIATAATATAAAPVNSANPTSASAAEATVTPGVPAVTPATGRRPRISPVNRPASRASSAPTPADSDIRMTR